MDQQDFESLEPYQNPVKQSDFSDYDQILSEVNSTLEEDEEVEIIENETLKILTRSRLNRTEKENIADILNSSQGYSDINIEMEAKAGGSFIEGIEGFVCRYRIVRM